MSKLIAICGADRCGKYTQTRKLAGHLWSIGKSAAVVEVPVKDNHTYRVIYWMLKNGLAKKLPRVFQFMQYLNRLIFQSFTLPVLERMNDYIIFDRWSLSSVVYGEASGLSRKFGENLYRKLRKPNYTIILLGRAHQHEAEDVYEKDEELQKKVRLLYKQWANENPYESCIVKSDDRNVSSVAANITTALENAGIIPS